jgi:hypothetical protein
MRHFFSETVKQQSILGNADAPVIFQLLEDPILNKTDIPYAEVVDSQRSIQIGTSLSYLGNETTVLQAIPFPWPAWIFPLIMLIVLLLSSSN